MDSKLMRNIAVKSITLILSLGFCIACYNSALAQSPSANDVVMVLPFENTSSRPEYNWVGESFADSISELLVTPGLIVVSSDEREIAYQKLRVPQVVIPSRATAIKLAR